VGLSLALCVLLRIWSPGRLGIGQDEAQFLNVSALPGVRGMVAFLYAHESHPPLLYLIAHFARLVGLPMPATMSFLMLLASVGTIGAAWWLASLSRLRGAGLSAALIVGLSIPLIIYSVQLRPYALFSLLLLVSVGAMVEGMRSELRRWRAVWAVSLLALLYTHHLGILVAQAETVALLIVGVRTGALAHTLRTWGIWWCAVALLSLPDALMALHQSRAAGYPVGVAVNVLGPVRQFLVLCWSYPAELLVSLLAAGGVLWSWKRSSTWEREAPLAGILGTTLAVLLLLMILAAYHSALLVPHVVLAVAPLGAAAAGVVLAGCFSRGSRIAGVIWLEFLVVSIGTGFVLGHGFAKTNIDLTGAYISAEAESGDVVLVVSGAIATSLNRQLRAPVTHLDYPLLHAVTAFPFDHEFERMADLGPLRATLDTIASACRAGRRIWFVSGAAWTLTAQAPFVLTRDEFGSFIRPSWARTSYLYRSLIAMYGDAALGSDPELEQHGMEMVRWKRFGPAPGGPSRGAAGSWCRP
jgi:hypothetical protein